MHRAQTCAAKVESGAFGQIPSHLEAGIRLLKGRAGPPTHSRRYRTSAQSLPLLIHVTLPSPDRDRGGNAQPVATGRLLTGGTFHIVVNNQIGFTTCSEDAAVVDVCDRYRQDDRSSILHCERGGSARAQVCQLKCARFSSGIRTRLCRRHSIAYRKIRPPRSR